MKRAVSLCLNPTIQHTMLFDRFREGEVNRAARLSVDASGKGVNLARVLAQLGERPLHVTHAGGRDAAWFAALCAAEGIELRACDSRSEIRRCHTAIDASKGIATELVEESAPVAPGTELALRKILEEAAHEAGALAISGSKAPGYSEGIFPWAAALYRARGAALVLDLRGPELVACMEGGAALAKPNLAELRATFGEGDAREVAVAAYERYRVPLLVTRGALDALFVDGSGLAELPVPAVRCLNPIGSGDACAAGVCAVLLRGGSLREAVAFGIECGSRNAASFRPGSLA